MDIILIIEGYSMIQGKITFVIEKTSQDQTALVAYNEKQRYVVDRGNPQYIKSLIDLIQSMAIDNYRSEKSTLMITYNREEATMSAIT